MAITLEDFANFQAFAEAHISGGNAESIEQLARLWQEFGQDADDLASIRRGIADADAGRTVPVADAFDAARGAIGRDTP
ncbi:hypothetical protein Pla175_04540 [Pirellulimonas nuda]|uniref:Uncharacterized protein n=1 Tax=Pirellulimonas nuda TaxID=2528009 RepID=A0A518D6N4_9BACT|nr:hypothetical protein [Pirellulimonas nuda]QDU87099.1 hypothetical protein Pla175_04540 [Pirellulimonas nuda]